MSYRYGVYGETWSFYNEIALYRDINYTTMWWYAVEAVFNELIYIYLKVLPGTFNALRNLLTNDRPGFQFKMPRVLRKENALEFLWQQRIKR